MPRDSLQGFTLLEAIIGLLITGILLNISLQTTEQFLMHQERYTSLLLLENAIHYTKQQASLRNETLWLCPSADAKRCQETSNWSHGYLAMTSKAHIIARFPMTSHYGKLSFNHSRHYLEISPHQTTSTLGTFTYCPRSKDPRQAEALVINRLLRLYRIQKKNAQGIPLKQANTPKEIPLTCQ